MATFLVTGGAGYIGSHVCKALHRGGHIPVVFDDLSSGDASYVKWGPLMTGDLLDAATVLTALQTYRPDCVIHLAAVSDPQAADANPVRAWEINVSGTRTLMREMEVSGTKNLIFGSTASVYGRAANPPFAEDVDLNPTGVYAETKLAAERAIEATVAASNLEAVIFRFFNVAGSDPDGETGEFRRDDAHLIPKLIDCVRRNEAFRIFGRDHNTIDGTCIRDYVHVLDIANAFLACAERMDGLAGVSRINLGAGHGASVLDVIQEVERLVGQRLTVRDLARRPFDPPVLVSNIGEAERALGWRPRYSILETMIRDSWRFRRALFSD